MQESYVLISLCNVRLFSPTPHTAFIKESGVRPPDLRSYHLLTDTLVQQNDLPEVQCGFMLRLSAHPHRQLL
jgi:hypothetical protein